MGARVATVFPLIWIIVVISIVNAVRKSQNGGRTSSHFRSPVRHNPSGMKGTSSGGPVRRIVRTEADGRISMEQEGSYPDGDVRPGKKIPAGAARPARSALKDSSALSELMIEDRKNDWLARQIREEKKRVVWNNFTDLGAVHDEACAAELNRMAHVRQHQSYVVDDGVSNE